MNDLEIGSVLGNRRRELHLRGKDIGKLIGIHYTVISRIEKGKRSIPLSALAKFSAAYKIPLYTLTTMIYGASSSSGNDNLLPHFRRIQEAGIESFSFNEMCELLEIERGLGFPMEPSQLKAWYSKLKK